MHQQKITEFYEMLKDATLRDALGKLLRIAVCPYLTYLVQCALNNVAPEKENAKKTRSH